MIAMEKIAGILASLRKNRAQRFNASDVAWFRRPIGGR